MTDTVINYFLCAACGGLVTWIIAGTRRLKSVTKVIKALSHDALFTRCEQLIFKGKITTDELENLDMLYDEDGEIIFENTGDMSSNELNEMFCRVGRYAEKIPNE